jgi:hypothetical protein
MGVVILAPIQYVLGLNVTTGAEGGVLTVIVVASVSDTPLASLTVTVYARVAVGDATGFEILALFKFVIGLHEYVKGESPPLDTEATNETDDPLQIAVPAPVLILATIASPRIPVNAEVPAINVADATVSVVPLNAENLVHPLVAWLNVPSNWAALISKSDPSRSTGK